MTLQQAIAKMREYEELNQAYNHAMGVLSLDGDTAVSHEITETPLSSNGTTHFSIDWTDIYGTLSPGEYVIRVIVKDIYEESQVHRLMRNFYDVQHYEISFTVE